MKVGTDGVLLGAWADVSGPRILDIGTGTGLIALMAAQRNPEAEVFAIDIEPEAVSQARDNVVASPFRGRVSVEIQDVLALCSNQHFNSILCNPPFFTEDTLPLDASRSLARNSAALPFPDLIRKVARLLAPDGTFSVIIPAQSMSLFAALCMTEGLSLSRRCLVKTTERKPPRRVLLTFTPATTASTTEETLCLTAPDGSRSQAYAQLAAEFYL